MPWKKSYHRIKMAGAGPRSPESADILRSLAKHGLVANCVETCLPALIRLQKNVLLNSNEKYLPVHLLLFYLSDA